MEIPMLRIFFIQHYWIQKIQIEQNISQSYSRANWLTLCVNRRLTLYNFYNSLVSSVLVFSGFSRRGLFLLHTAASNWLEQPTDKSISHYYLHAFFLVQIVWNARARKTKKMHEIRTQLFKGAQPRAVKEGHDKNLTKTGNCAWKVSGTQGIQSADRAIHQTNNTLHRIGIRKTK